MTRLLDWCEICHDQQRTSAESKLCDDCAHILAQAWMQLMSFCAFHNDEPINGGDLVEEVSSLRTWIQKTT